jgi:hypothetical protein
MTKAFDQALFVPAEAPDVGQAVGIQLVGPPFDTTYFYYVVAPGPGVTLGSSIPPATDVGQILVSGPGPNFQWMTDYELYLGALPTPPSTNPAPGAPTPPPNGAMYFNTNDGTPYILDGAKWTPLPVATTNRVTVAASLPAATGAGQMLLSGPVGNPGGTTAYPWTASPGFFLGAHPTPPIQTSIPVGSMYYNTSNNTLYVWSGSAWQTLTTPTKAATASLYYQSAINQMVYPTTTADLFGQTYTATSVEAVEIYLNGVRLTPDGGSIPGDFTFNYATSTLTLSTVPPTGSIITIDVLQDPLSLSPTLILREMLQPITTFDGVETTFDLIAMSGTGIVVNDPVDLNVSLDGVLQDPGVDYQLSTDGSQIIFAEPPIADAQCFIIYFSKSATGFLSAVLHDLTMTGDGTAANPLASVMASPTPGLPGVVYVPGQAGTVPNALTIDQATGELGLDTATVAEIIAGTDDVLPVTSSTLRTVTGADVANLTTTARFVIPAINELVDTTVDLEARKVDRAGDTMTGPLLIALPPTSSDMVTNKQYVDESIAANALYQGVWDVAPNVPDLTPGVMNPLNGWSWISETVNPDVPEQAPAALPGIGGMMIDSGDRIIWDAAGAIYNLVKGSSLSIVEARTIFVEIAGDTMTGPLLLNGDPTLGVGAATKDYVDAGDASLNNLKVDKAGDVMSGSLGFQAGNGLVFSDGSQVYQSSLGPLTLQEGAPGFQPQIADGLGQNPRDIIDTVNGDLRYVNTTGGTMTGPLTLYGDPPTPGVAANKNYVDNEIITNNLFKGIWIPGINFPDLTPGVMNPQHGWTWLCQTGSPNTPETVPPGIPGISGLSVDCGWSVWWNDAAGQYVLAVGPNLSYTTAQNDFVNKIGDTMSGALTINNTLTATGNATFGGTLTASNALFANGGIILTGIGGLAMSGNASITGCSNLTMSGTLTAGNTGTGQLQIHAGQTVQTPEISFYTPEGTRRGYIGYGSANVMHMKAENGYRWQFDDALGGTLSVYAGAGSGTAAFFAQSTTNNTAATSSSMVFAEGSGAWNAWLYSYRQGWNNRPEAQLRCDTAVGGWGNQNVFNTTVNSPPGMYFQGDVSCTSLAQRCLREMKSTIRDARKGEHRDAWDALKVRRFKMTDKYHDWGRERWGFVAEELPEEIAAYAAPGSSDPAQMVKKVEGIDVGQALALCVAKIKELETEIVTLKSKK